ncbi:MAG: FAD-linked oxidase C-terminal domain-containing protein [candidate division Zixibacteria bacterium]
MSVRKRKDGGYFGGSKVDSNISREAYGSDASIYRLLPQEVYCPSTSTELLEIVWKTLKNNTPITPRGGGTGLSGGALGNGVIIDCSRLTKIKAVERDAKTVTCQTGVIYRDLNLSLKKDNLFFPPDPSSGDSCQIGGMLANNSSGPSSVKYGLTSHYVEELRIINSQGEEVELKKLALDSAELNEFVKRFPEYEQVLKILSENKNLIQDRWPKVKKNSAGYNLKQIVDDFENGIFNLPALYIGSEGTLGLFVSVKLCLRNLPDENLSYRLFFGSLEDAGQAIAPLLSTKPSALEIVDGSTLDLIGRDEFMIPVEAEAMLLLEYNADIEASKSKLESIIPQLKLLHPPEEADDPEKKSKLWAARRAIVPILYRHDAIKRPLPFIEDASLPIECLTEFIAWVKGRLAKHGLVFGLFGHIGDGNLHIRPLLNLAGNNDRLILRELYDEVYAKIVSLGGSSTAEHADGRLRAPVVKDVYGEEIYEIFQKVKSILDPDNLMNPGVILSQVEFTENIDLKKLELACAACGKCNGYCPAFEAFRREDMSPRGWLRMLHFSENDHQVLSESLKFCLNCKNCTTVCPAGIDIAEEILKYKDNHPSSKAGRIISVFDNKSAFEKIMNISSLANPFISSVVGKNLMSIVGRVPFGFDDEVELPLPARRNFRQRYSRLIDSKSKVAIFHGCADNYLESRTGDALVNVLEHLDIHPVIPEQDCCGLPMEVYGHRDNMISRAKKNLDALEGYDSIVFTCASCLHRIQDYKALFEENSEYWHKAKSVESRLYDICGYLLYNRDMLPRLKTQRPIRLTYHHPCHLRAAKRENEPLKLLGMIEGIEIIHPDLADRCCGQAGSFGYIHYQEGKAIFRRKREEYIEIGADYIVSSCPSCISKIKKEMGPGFHVCHPIEIISVVISGKL